MGNSALPAYAAWRYRLAITRARGRANITLIDRETGTRLTHEDVQAGRRDPHPVPAADVDAVVRDMVRLADARRASGDVIGEAARAALYVARLYDGMHAGDPAGSAVDARTYASVLEHLADVAAMLGALGAQGGDLCHTFGENAVQDHEEFSVPIWREAQARLGDVRAGARGAHKAAALVANLITYIVDFPHGDADGPPPGGDLLDDGPLDGAAFAALLDGVENGVAPARPVDPTVRPERLGDLLDDTLDRLAGRSGLSPVDVVLSGCSAGRGGPPSAPIDLSSSLTPVGVVGAERAGLDWSDPYLTRAIMERIDGRDPFIVIETSRDVAALLLAGLDPRAVGRNLSPDTLFFHISGRPVPHYAMNEEPAGLTPDQLEQFARDVYALYVRLGPAIGEAGAMVVNVPGRGVLLLPEGADLAEVCARLGIEGEVEQ